MKLILAVLCAFALLQNAKTAEPWSDPRLAQKSGLELWFDASRQAAGREAMQLPAILPGMPTSYLLDSSGRQRHLAQLEGGARPILQEENGRYFLRFDGTNDALLASRLAGRYRELTLFVVATPAANPGNFTGVCGLTRSGFNDYTSGLNLDLGATPSAQLSFLNVESAGASGLTQMMSESPLPFGTWHVLGLVSRVGTKGVMLKIDGQQQGARDRRDSEIMMDEFVLGGRCYSNQADPPFVQGFFHGDIAEVLLYDHALSDAERDKVEEYLKQKYANLLARAPVLQGNARPLVTASNLPPVQVFLPGFRVRELPVSLRNINNVKYRADGKLFALGYDGQVHLLADQDNDGLEEQVKPFWPNDTLRSPIGMALTPPNYAKGQGVFVASKGKISLLVDTNSDDRADQEIVVTEGWKELAHSVDALGVALDKEGSVYFGLGTANFTDAYLIDKSTGRASYDLRNERGTILKVSPDFSHREIVCTGIRFPVGMAFYRNGDLFCTDQEGATWLPNGNPLDELLFIQAGRHYGFPPRHPRHLPGVIDEPSVFDYSPQHQSTCGLNFNTTGNGRIFGPEQWRDDAIISGYSRGKIWRTKLVKSRNGYVAQTQLIASLTALTVDACVSPAGDLLISTHSGEPDWGSGPSGPGRLYKVHYAEPGLPQPLFASMPAPGQFEISFDRPLDPAALKELAKRVEITQGKYVSAGDRFELKRPGYAVIYHQLSTPRYDLPIEGASISGDARTLRLWTSPADAAVNYGIKLSQFERGETSAGLPQHRDVDLATDANGVQVQWRSADGTTPEWQGWLPHVDSEVAEALTKGSANHETLWQNLPKPGTLIIQGQLDLWQMLQPAIQPGATLDYERPRESLQVEFSANAPFTAHFGRASKAATRADAAVYRAIFEQPSQTEWLPFAIEAKTGAAPLVLSAAWSTSDDPRARSFALKRFLMPWAKPEIKTSAPESTRPPELAGGNWLRGRRLFFGEIATCSKCHAVRGEGKSVGPDLSNLVHRDYASVLKDIRFPNAALNPDHLSYTVQLRDGEEMTGVLQSDAKESVTLADASGQKRIPRTEIQAMRATGTSLMPEGLDKALGEEQLRDLLTFLLLPPLEPSPIHISGVPAARTRGEVDAVLTADSAPTDTRPFRILLSSGPKDHGTDEHDYPLWRDRWSRLLALDEGVRLATCEGWPSPEAMEAADVIVFYSNNPGWSAEKVLQLDQFQERGGGLVYIHFAVDGHDAVSELSERIGLAWKGGQSKFRHGELDLQLEQAHPITRGLFSLKMHDESYWNLVGDPNRVHVLATQIEDGLARPLIWTFDARRGRVFVSIPGHYTWSFDDPLFRAVLLRGICWAGRREVNRLDELATLGARMSDSAGTLEKRAANLDRPYPFSTSEVDGRCSSVDSDGGPDRRTYQKVQAASSPMLRYPTMGFTTRY